MPPFVLGFADVFPSLVSSTLNVHIIKDTHAPRKHTEEVKSGTSHYPLLFFFSKITRSTQVRDVDFTNGKCP